jgi:hypothetical protein
MPLFVLLVCCVLFGISISLGVVLGNFATLGALVLITLAVLSVVKTTWSKLSISRQCSEVPVSCEVTVVRATLLAICMFSVLIMWITAWVVIDDLAGWFEIVPSYVRR